MVNTALKQEYTDKLVAMKDFCAERLRSKGLHVEDTGDQIGLSISMTQFGLSTIYATLTQEEIEYIVDNEIEL